MSHIIRGALSIALLIGVYHETGIFTTLAIALSLLNAELLAFLVRTLRKKS